MSASERIRAAASLKGMTLKEFSESIGISYRTLQNYISGERGIGSEFLTAAAERLGVSATWILTGLGAPMIGDTGSDHTEQDAPFVPVTRFRIEASAGYGTLVQDETGSGSYAFSRKFLEKRNLSAKHLAVISVKGDSMEPDLRDGDLILIDQAQTDPKAVDEGKIYVVRYGDELFVKRIQRLPQDGLMLVSSNPVYHPVTVDEGQMDGVKIIGRVVNSTHEW